MPDGPYLISVMKARFAGETAVSERLKGASSTGKAWVILIGGFFGVLLLEFAHGMSLAAEYSRTLDAEAERCLSWTFRDIRQRPMPMLF